MQSNSQRVPGKREYQEQVYQRMRASYSSHYRRMVPLLVNMITIRSNNTAHQPVANEVAFGFCHLLGFRLMPRLKNIYAQRLARPETGKPDAYPNLQPILSKPIDWDLIREQYDQMIKFAKALRLGTAETEAILRRFNQKEATTRQYVR